MIYFYHKLSVQLHQIFKIILIGADTGPYYMQNFKLTIFLILIFKDAWYTAHQKYNNSCHRFSDLSLLLKETFLASISSLLKIRIIPVQLSCYCLHFYTMGTVRDIHQDFMSKITTSQKIWIEIIYSVDLNKLP